MTTKFEINKIINANMKFKFRKADINGSPCYDLVDRDNNRLYACLFIDRVTEYRKKPEYTLYIPAHEHEFDKYKEIYRAYRFSTKINVNISLN